MPPSRHTSGRRAPGRVLGGVTVAGLAAIVVAAWASATGSVPSGDRRLGAGAAVTRGRTRLAGIERVSPGRGPGRLPRYLAPAQGQAIDSARVGVLAAWLLPGTASGTEPVIALVPRDSVAGLPLVARLVVTPGEAGLLVYGAAGSRP